jgi:hypothetical protein
LPPPPPPLLSRTPMCMNALWSCITPSAHFKVMCHAYTINMHGIITHSNFC